MAVVAACAVLLLAAPARAEGGHGGTPHEEPKKKSSRPSDLLQLVEGNPFAWSVQTGGKGCYLVSAFRNNTSRLAVGRHPAVGSGLFVNGLGVSKPDLKEPEPVTLQVGDGAWRRDGRIVGAMLLFVPLAPAETAELLRELEGSGPVWVGVRGAAMAHGGTGIGAAVAEFRTRCGGAAPGAEAAHP